METTVIIASPDKYLVRDKNDMSNIAFCTEAYCSNDEASRWEEIEEDEYKTLVEAKQKYDIAKIEEYRIAAEAAATSTTETTQEDTESK